jgi:hypothetical protein
VATGIIVFNIVLNFFLVFPSNLDFSGGLLGTYRNVGEWLENNTDESSRIAVAMDVGAIGYYSEREIIDLAGLNTLEVIPYLPDSMQYVFVSQPDHLVITGETKQYELLSVPEYHDIAFPLLSLRMDRGFRTEVEEATGGRQQEYQYVTIYELSWPQLVSEVNIRSCGRLEFR